MMPFGRRRLLAAGSLKTSAERRAPPPGTHGVRARDAETPRRRSGSIGGRGALTPPRVKLLLLSERRLFSSPTRTLKATVSAPALKCVSTRRSRPGPGPGPRFLYITYACPDIDLQTDAACQPCASCCSGAHTAGAPEVHHEGLSAQISTCRLRRGEATR